MKKLALLFAFLPSFALLADTVVLQDNGTLTLNGVGLNNASDALLNKQVTSSAFMAALRQKLDATNALALQVQADIAGAQKSIQDAAAANAAAVEAARAETATLQTLMRQRLDGDLVALKAALQAATDPTQQAVITGKIAVIQGYLDAAFQTTAQLRAAALAAEIAAKQAELDKLQNP